MLASVKTVAKKSVVETDAPPPFGKYSVPVVRSTFLLLEELSRAGSLELKDLTKRTKLPKSTIFRILTTLAECGYVVRDSLRSYRISPSLGQLITEDTTGDTLRTLAHPHMLELRDRYGETVNLGVRRLDKVTYLEVVPSEFALRLQESRGSSVPAHASALGKAILAFTPIDQVEGLVRGHRLDVVTPNTISNADDFLAELKRVRKERFAYDRGEGSLLAVCVGAPILDARGQALAAMSISGPASRFNPKKDSAVITSLLTAVAEISKSLARGASHR